MNGIVVSPDGSELFVGGGDGAVWSSDLTTSRTIGATATRHAAPVIDAARSDDGDRLATLGNDQNVRLWDRSAAPPAVATLGEIGGPGLRHRGRPPAAASSRWATATARCTSSTPGPARPQGTLDGHAGQVFGVAYLPSGPRS